MIREPDRQETLAELYAAMGAPRIAMSLRRVVDGQLTQSREAQRTLEVAFKDNKFRVFSADPDRNPDKQSQVADLLVRGTSVADFDRSMEVEGLTFHFYRASFNADIVRLSTQEVLSSTTIKLSDEVDVSAMSKVQARDRSLLAVEQAGAEDLLNKLRAYWEQTRFAGDTFSLIVRGDSPGSLSRMESYLRQDGRVRTVKRRTVQGTTGHYDIQFTAGQTAFLELILAESDKPRILEEADHHLIITLVNH
jgi:hypothetical protein